MSMYRKIFILYQRGIQTGGPEALHQLADALNNLGLDAYMVPMKGTASNLRVPAYDHFNAPEIDQVEDAADCAVIAPETGINELRGIRDAEKFCWWLSVDNSTLVSCERSLLRVPADGFINRLKRIKYRVGLPLQTIGRFRARLASTTHLAQSHYAWAFINSRFGIVPSMLSDYTNSQEIISMARSDQVACVIAYNPAKGGAIIQELKASLGESISCEWLPIVHMTRTDVIRALRRTTVYVDLGHHPGKDRIPREAATAGAVVLVGRRGSGSYFADVPIPWEHKIDMSRPISDATRALRLIVEDTVGELAKQEDYRRTIAHEKQRFVLEVMDIFISGRRGSDCSSNASVTAVNF